MNENNKNGWVVARYTDILLNSLEWLADESEEVMKFSSKDKAVDFLKENEVTDDEIEWLVFCVNSICPNCKEELIIHEQEIINNDGILSATCYECNNEFTINF